MGTINENIIFMKLSKIITITASFVLTSTMANAAHVWEDPGSWAGNTFTYDHKNGPLFSANELSLDLGASYTAGERGIEHLFKTSIKAPQGTWGGDVGLNYFITSVIGLGADINMPDNGGNLVDGVLGNLIVRLPLGESGFAPYLFGGGGRTTDRAWEWVGQAGLGLEFRLSHTLGLFADGRYIWPQHSSDALLLRTGIRIVF